MNRMQLPKEGLTLLKGPNHVTRQGDGSLLVKLTKSGDVLHFDNCDDFREYVKDELAEFVAMNPWNNKLDAAQSILYSI